MTETDAAVWSAMETAGRPLPVTAIAERAGVTMMVAVSALRRLYRSRPVYKHTELIDTPARLQTTVVYYSLACRPRSCGLPAWLAPSADGLPAHIGSRRVVCQAG